MEQKPAASLTGSLIARKGEAAPAISPAFGFQGVFPDPPAAPPQEASEPQTTSEPQPSPKAVDNAATPKGASQKHSAPKRGAQKRAAQKRTAQKRAAMTLRLDEARHLRLRLVSAHLRRSCQSVLTEALDAYFDSHRSLTAKPCPCLDESAKPVK
jgi:hypothetical protein